MISRRFLIIKTFQALYAYFQSEDKQMGKAEKELFFSIEKMHDLYLFFLLLPNELVHQNQLRMENAKEKRLPSEEDKNPNTKFVNNKVFEILAINEDLNNYAKDRKITWDKVEDQETISKFLIHLRAHSIFTTYMSTQETSYEEDKKFVVDLYKKIIPEFELLLSEIEDKSIYWGYDEIDFALSMVLKSVKKLDEKSDNKKAILALYRDKKDDTQFVKDLFRTSITEDEKNSKLIGDKTKNWDVERIANVDVLLMKMALTELLNFKAVPVKVTLNEYIELSKWYSTPKSKVFVNGILDKLVAELKQNGTLKKMGRGLLES